jgi:hypothetical protein
MSGKRRKRSGDGPKVATVARPRDDAARRRGEGRQQPARQGDALFVFGGCRAAFAAAPPFTREARRRSPGKPNPPDRSVLRSGVPSLRSCSSFEAGSDIPATSRASQPRSTTTVTSARPSSSRPTATSIAAPAEGRRRWRQTRSRGHVRARRIGSWAPSPGALGAPTSFRRDDGDRTPRPGLAQAPSAAARWSRRLLGAASATSSPRRLQPAAES